MITREEAIRHFESYVDNECYTDLCQDACRMAISAIRSQDGAARLAASEKHGLEPCDYATMKGAMENEKEARSQLSEVLGYIGGLSLDHLRELVNAEKEGRLAILPPDDNPLTEEELRKMDGQPVRCEIVAKGNPPFYGIVHGNVVTGYVPGKQTPISLEISERGAFGLAWVAYRCKEIVFPLNKLLTLEELQEMNGEPVWVCSPYDPQNGRYGVVWVSPKWELENWFVATVSESTYFAAYGKVWVAYRRRPEVDKKNDYYSE